MYSNFDINTYLANLPSTIQVIDVSYQNLTYLPDLSRFTNLLELNCSNNNLNDLPPFNPTLTHVNCSFTPFNISNADFISIKNN